MALNKSQYQKLGWTILIITVLIFTILKFSNTLSIYDTGDKTLDLCLSKGDAYENKNFCMSCSCRQIPEGYNLNCKQDSECVDKAISDYEQLQLSLQPKISLASDQITNYSLLAICDNNIICGNYFGYKNISNGVIDKQVCFNNINVSNKCVNNITSINTKVTCKPNYIANGNSCQVKTISGFMISNGQCVESSYSVFDKQPSNFYYFKDTCEVYLLKNTEQSLWSKIIDFFRSWFK